MNYHISNYVINPEHHLTTYEEGSIEIQPRTIEPLLGLTNFNIVVHRDGRRSVIVATEAHLRGLLSQITEALDTHGGGIPINEQ